MEEMIEQETQGDQIYGSEVLDHLGIVAGLCRKIDLIGTIDRHIGATERNVSVGEAVQAMVINALGFVSRPLYLSPEFFRNKPVEILIGEGRRAEEFNEDSLGRALDAVYAAGVTGLFAKVASHALNGFGIEYRYCHLDTTTFSLHGEYASGEAGGASLGREAPATVGSLEEPLAQGLSVRTLRTEEQPSASGTDLEGTSWQGSSARAPSAVESANRTGVAAAPPAEEAQSVDSDRPAGSRQQAGNGDQDCCVDAVSDEPRPVKITYGYSKDQRPDLKQVVVGLITTFQSKLPVWLSVLDGNRSDAKSFPEMIQAYIDQLKETDPQPHGDPAPTLPTFIADCALYSAISLPALSNAKWISRVPETIAATREWLDAPDPGPLLSTPFDGYELCEWESDYAGVDQRWIGVVSEPARQREEATLKRRIALEHDRARAQWKKLGVREFGCEADARAKAQELIDAWKYHQADVSVGAVPHYRKAGRPSPNHPPDRIGYQIEGTLSEDPKAIASAQCRLGRFILATNTLDRSALPAEEALAAYKSQAHAVESGFRFLKDPIFFAHSLFLKKPERIMALLMIMTLSLLIYSLGEHHLRAELKQHHLTVPDQKGRPTQRPTLRRIFQVFEGVHLLRIAGPSGAERKVLNLSLLHRQILELFGPEVVQSYVLVT